MNVLQAVRQRRSIRTYRRTPIPDQALDRLVLALRCAPSSGNLQCRKFYFVFNAALRRKLAKIAWDQKFVAEAPLCVVACADHRIEREYGQPGVDLFCLLDVAASIQNLGLVAHEEGLGTCWVGAFDEQEVRDLLDLPKHLRPVSLVSVGYPDEEPEAPPRHSRRRAIVEIH